MPVSNSGVFGPSECPPSRGEYEDAHSTDDETVAKV